MNSNKVYLSIGSNLGDKINNLQNAINLIDSEVGNVSSISKVYQTKAEGFEGDDFFNCCVSLNTSLRPIKLLNKLLEIEILKGRLRSSSKSYQSRNIDIHNFFMETKPSHCSSPE